MNEGDGLALLDRRMREASGELRRAVEAAMSDGLSSGTIARSRSSAPPELASVISLDGSTPHGRRRGRWPWAAAAAVVAAVGVAGVIVFGGGDDEAPPATTVVQPFLLPGWLPPDWRPQLAVRNPDPSSPPATATVYDSTTLVDLQEGAFVSVLRVDTTEPLDASDSGTVVVAGHQASLRRDNDTWSVTVPVDRRTVVVSGRGITREDILRVAAAAVEGRPVEPELPTGLEKIADGSLDLTGEPGADSLTLRYGADSGAETVTVTQRPGRPSELGLVLMMLPAPNTVTEVTVRGQRAIRAEWEESSGVEGVTEVVQWLEPPGLLVTVWADGPDDESLDRLIESMRESTGTEVDELVDAYPEPPDANGDVAEDDGAVDEASNDPATNDAVESDSYAVAGIVVAEGDRGADHWTVAVEESAGSFSVNYADVNQSFGFAAAGDPGPAPILEVFSGDRPDDLGATALIGVAGDSIARVVVEADGHPPLPVELYRRDQVSRTVIVGFVPPDYRNGEVVGLDRRGREVARTPINE